MEDEKDIELQDQTDELDNDNNTEETEENKDDPQYRGKVLMQQALKHLEEGNIEEFETDRALANEYFDKMNQEEEEMDALYNESRNFGIIYNVIEANVPKLLESRNGKNTLRNIVKTIKGNKILHEQFKAFNNLQPMNRIANSEDYINEALQLSPFFNKDAVKKANEKLIHLIKEGKLNEMVDIDDDKLTLFESIEYVTMNPKTLSNIDEFISAKNIIKESIEKLPIKNKNENTIESYAKDLNSASVEIAESLNSDEMKLIKEVANGNGESYFNECKRNTLRKLNEMIENEIDIETKSRLSQIHEKINNKSYNKKTAIVDIAEMVELQHTIDE